MRNAALHFLVGRSTPVAGRSAGRPAGGVSIGAIMPGNGRAHRKGAPMLRVTRGGQPVTTRQRGSSRLPVRAAVLPTAPPDRATRGCTRAHPLGGTGARSGEDGGLLRPNSSPVSVSVSVPHDDPLPIIRLTCGQLREDDLVPVLDQVRADADELRRVMLG